MTTAGKRVAEILRDAEPELDQLRQARLERRFLDVACSPLRLDASSARDGLPANVAPIAPPARPRWPYAVGGASLAVLAAAAFVTLREPPGSPLRLGGPDGPHYTIAHLDEAPIAVGTVIEVATGDEARADVHHLAIVASAGASVRFTSVDEDDVRLVLDRGAAHFAFHPVVRGEEHVTIDTPSARVEIVGTELSVRVDASGTEVSVDEGRVRVVPADGSGETYVSAGEHVRVAAAATASAAATATAAAAGSATEAAAAAATAAVAATEAAAAAAAPDSVAVTADGVLEPARVETPQERLERLDLELDDDPVAARRGLRELASSAPRSVRIEAYLLLGDSYRDSHENDEALSAYASAARIGRGTTSGAQALYERATLYERMAHLDDARTAWARYLDEYPNGADAGRARARLEALDR